MKSFENKFLGWLLIMFIAYYSTYAQKVDQQLAKNYVISWLTDKYSGRMIKDIIPQYYQGVLTLYKIDLKPQGFILLSASQNVKPVLAYSFQHNFPDEPKAGVRDFLQSYSAQIYEVINNHLTNITNQRKWQHGNNMRQNRRSTAQSVGPLINTNWDQDYPYNQFCPADANAPSGYNGHVPVGCVAVAAGQIMKKWEAPAHGNAAYSYTHPQYGVLSADLLNTTYDWTGMDNSLTPVAELLYQIGVVVEMNYSASESAANIYNNDGPNLHLALAAFFNYTSEYKERNNFNDNDWIALLKNELDNGRPFIYSGRQASSPGHAWVCDGYDTDDLFHMNWGWGGYYNGYYSIDDLTPGQDNYTDRQKVLINIMPVTTIPEIQELSEEGQDMFNNNNYNEALGIYESDNYVGYLSQGDEDWYEIIYDDGNDWYNYHLLVKGANDSVKGYYKLIINMNNNLLNVTTSGYGAPVDTYLELDYVYKNGTKKILFASDDNGAPEPGYSQLSYDFSTTSLTYMPDLNFREELFYQDYFSTYFIFNEHVYTDILADITYLDVSYENISDMTGIEDFSALQTLICYENNLTSLDVSQNSNLELLNCRNNQITDLDISHNAQLRELYCRNNQLSSLNTSQNTLLEKLYCRNNNISELDLRQNTQLVEMDCYNNLLSYLDVRNGHNDQFTYFYAKNNSNLTCIFVDNKDASYLSDWYIDSTTHFVETQTECDALNVEDNNLTNLKIFPNPVDNSLFIINRSGVSIEKVKIYNIEGQLINVWTNPLNKMDVSHLQKGLYLLKIYNKNHKNKIFKMIKI